MSEAFEVPAGVPLFDSPEEAALDGWRRSPGAEARVVEVRPSADGWSVWVVVQLGEATGHHDQDLVTCVHAGRGRWWAAGSTGSGSPE